jgi:hypothetical protein
MKRTTRARIALALPLALAAFSFAGSARAFCGFYVGGADKKLFNNATQVALMREGTRTVLSMQNNYEGPPENFAMVVPVPVVLQKENVKTLPREVFDTLDGLTAPRLVEYWEQDPCAPGMQQPGTAMARSLGAVGFGMGGGGRGSAEEYKVTVEAHFEVGEYDIVILSAKDASGLEAWLKDQKYKIPEGAQPYLKPYVQAGSKFFVAKVNAEKVKFEKGMAKLSPLRFHYDSDTFSLPLRLGLVNAKDSQDLIVYVLGKGQRYEATNYANTTIPTNLDVTAKTKDEFPSFYAALFDDTVKKHPKSVVTEYSWDAGTCDPCPGPMLTPGDIKTLGEDVLPTTPTTPKLSAQATANDVTGAFKQSVVQRVLYTYMAAFQECEVKTAKSDDTLDFKVEVDKGGRVAGVTPKESKSKDETAAACLAAATKRIAFPAKDGTTSFTLHFAFNGTSYGYRPSGPYAYVVTRLHARYDKETLGEDIVFRAAKPIEGGREFTTANGELSHDAKASTANNFQGRYAIRHPWTGPILCENPGRGHWGARTDDDDYSGSKPTPVKDVAFAKRDVVLASFIATDVPKPASAYDAPPVAGTSAPAVAPSSAPIPAPPKKSGCSTGGGGSGNFALGGLALTALAILRLRRKDRS